jgi:predicted acyltransferase (DUF342 family)
MAITVALPAGASPLILTDFGIFAGQGPVQIQGGATINGAVGTGGALSVGSNSTVNGDIHADGDVTIQGGADVNGSVNTGGNFAVGSNSALQDVNANGGATIQGGSTVAGTVTAGGNVSVGSNSAMSGAGIVAGGFYFQGGGGSAPASLSTGVNPVPVPYAADTLDGVILPPGVTPTSPVGSSQIGGSNQVLNLAPGSYELLTYGGGLDLFLTSGNYYFSSLTLGSNSQISYDLSGGGINVFVDGNATIQGGSKWDLTDGTAADILWEIGGDLNVGSNAFLLGTIYTSGTTTIQDADDITIQGGAKITGALYSMGGIYIGSNTEFNYVQHNSFGQTQPGVIPLPAGLPLLLGALGALGVARRRRHA